MPEGAFECFPQTISRTSLLLKWKLLNLFHFAEGGKFLFSVDSGVLLVVRGELDEESFHKNQHLLNDITFCNKQKRNFLISSVNYLKRFKQHFQECKVDSQRFNQQRKIVPTSLSVGCRRQSMMPTRLIIWEISFSFWRIISQLNQTSLGHFCLSFSAHHP